MNDPWRCVCAVCAAPPAPCPFSSRRKLGTFNVVATAGIAAYLMFFYEFPQQDHIFKPVRGHSVVCTLSHASMVQLRHVLGSGVRRIVGAPPRDVAPESAENPATESEDSSSNSNSSSSSS